LQLYHLTNFSKPHYCLQFSKLQVNVLPPHIHDHRDAELVNDHKPALFCQGVITTEENLEIKSYFIHQLLLNWP